MLVTKTGPSLKFQVTLSFVFAQCLLGRARVKEFGFIYSLTVQLLSLVLLVKSKLMLTNVNHVNE